jgi:hypothetical protein
VDFASPAAAQAELIRNPNDPHNLDADNDGIPCETLPNGLAEDNTSLPGVPTSPRVSTAASTAAASPVSQAAVRPAGGVGAGDGSTAEGGSNAIPYTVGVLALVGAGGAAVASRRSSRRSD